MLFSKFRVVALSLVHRALLKAATPAITSSSAACSLVSDGEEETAVSPLPPSIVDIDVEAMMSEDFEFAKQFGSSFRHEEEQPIEGESDKEAVRGGVPLAPVNIDADEDEEETRQGTVDVERYDDEKLFEYPPIPQVRHGEYDFKGIKIFLPQRLLRPETFRYRLNAGDQQQLADDIRVCKFDK